MRTRGVEGVNWGSLHPIAVQVYEVHRCVVRGVMRQHHGQVGHIAICDREFDAVHCAVFNPHLKTGWGYLPVTFGHRITANDFPVG